MPIETSIDEEAKRIVSTVSGDFCIEDIIEAISGSLRDPRFRRGFTILSDHTAVGEPLTPVLARQMVDHLETLREYVVDSRWAVVTAKPASYGMLRMVSVIAERVPMHVQVFRSHEEAEVWLTSPEADL